MKQLLRKETLRLVTWLLLGAVLGYYWDQPALGAAAAVDSVHPDG